MPWVRFGADFDWKPRPNGTQAYRAGEEKLVTTACAKAAIATRKAERTTKPKEGADGSEQ